MAPVKPRGPAGKTNPRSSRKILIIDDEALVRLTIGRMVERAGHRAVQAANGIEGLKISRREPIDVVVCDIIMPEMEGIETIRELRRDKPDVKIIAMSGSGSLDAVEFLTLAKKWGADYTLVKPFGRDEFMLALDACLAALE